MRNFDEWLKQLRPSIATYDYYVDFQTVVENARVYKAELHTLNALIGSQNIENEFRDLLKRFPQVISAIPILLAKRESEIFAKDCDGGGVYSFRCMAKEGLHSVDDYCVFMNKTGLFKMLTEHIVSNLYDYVLGVETGLSSNGRKGRGGDLMEDLVEGFLQRAGVEYFKEVKSGCFMSRWGIDLSPLTNDGVTTKKFDFVVRTEKCIYGIETNFYASNGSKLNETARSYKMLALESKSIAGFRFVWFTDGAAWNSARQNLRETFEVLPDLYNIQELEDGIAERLFV